MFPKNSGYKYSPARMHLVQLDGKGLDDGVRIRRSNKGKGSNYGSNEATRDMYQDVEAITLDKGEYYIIAEVDWI